MARTKKTTDAVSILRRRYIGDDPTKKLALEMERVNSEAARLIYDIRTSAGLSQKELAALVGTTQSVISRLEDADYEGHSLTMLNRIARALDRRLTVVVTSKEEKTRLDEFVRSLRKESKLTA